MSIVILRIVNVIPLLLMTYGACPMTRITTRVSDEMVEALDAAAARLRRSRADVMRQALEQYLEDFDDLSAALDRLRDPSDLILQWDDVRPGILGSD